MALPREIMQRYIHKQSGLIYLHLAHGFLRRPRSGWDNCRIFCPDNSEHTVFVVEESQFVAEYEEYNPS